jgi:hypothetical protein
LNEAGRHFQAIAVGSADVDHSQKLNGGLQVRTFKFDQLEVFSAAFLSGIAPFPTRCTL